MWDGVDRRESRRVKHPDGFMYDKSPTLLYLGAITMLSGLIVVTDIHTTASVKDELENLVADSCAAATDEAFIAERESDAQFAAIFERMERNINLLLDTRDLRQD